MSLKCGQLFSIYAMGSCVKSVFQSHRDLTLCMNVSPSGGQLVKEQLTSTEKVCVSSDVHTESSRDKTCLLQYYSIQHINENITKVCHFVPYKKKISVESLQHGSRVENTRRCAQSHSSTQVDELTNRQRAIVVPGPLY